MGVYVCDYVCDCVCVILRVSGCVFVTDKWMIVCVNVFKNLLYLILSNYSYLLVLLLILYLFFGLFLSGFTQFDSVRRKQKQLEEKQCERFQKKFRRRIHENRDFEP